MLDQTKGQGHKVVFAERDPEIASRISRVFGEEEVREYQEGISYGAHRARDGVSLSQVQRTRPVVSASRIQSLRTNEVYVRIPGLNAAARLSLPIA